MLAELESYHDQLISTTQDATGLMSGLSDAQFTWRPEANRWSMSECFDHLNMSTENLFLPAIDAAIDDAKRRGLTSAGPFVYSALERLFVKLSEPPPRLRFKAPRSFRPSNARPLAPVNQDFVQWQERLRERITQADGVDLRRARHRGPVGFWRFSLGTFFAMALAHQRRHIWQAREVRKASGFPG